MGKVSNLFIINGVNMEFLFYMVACFGLIALTFPLFSIAGSLEKLASVIQFDTKEPVRAHIRTWPSTDATTQNLYRQENER